MINNACVYHRAELNESVHYARNDALSQNLKASNLHGSSQGRQAQLRAIEPQDEG